MNAPKKLKFKILILTTLLNLIATACLSFYGCSNISGYTNESLFPKGLSTVCLDMFDNQSFRRGVEYELSDALSKRIEADTPYKIVSSKDLADTVISGQILSITDIALTTDRQTGWLLEKQLQAKAVVNWKNIKTGELLINNKSVLASASYSEFQNQDFTYASALVANNLAKRIVELMENKQ